MPIKVPEHIDKVLIQETPTFLNEIKVITIRARAFGPLTIPNNTLNLCIRKRHFQRGCHLASYRAEADTRQAGAREIRFSKLTREKSPSLLLHIVDRLQ